MAEHINREALLKDISETVLFTVRGGVKTPTAEMRGANKVIDRIKSFPAADVVEVVRCKDCFHSRPLCHTEKKLYNDDCVGCTKISTSYHSVIMSENDFCSYGEKMDGNGEGE